MLKTKPLHQLLSQSISSNVSSALLFTPSGSLLATGTSPTAPEAKKARTHAALASNIWTAYSKVADSGTIEQCLPSTPSSSLPDPPKIPQQQTPSKEDHGLKSLTLELSDYNLHIQVVAPRVLLCLIGPKQPTRQSSSSSSLHSQDGDKDSRVSPPGSVAKSGGSGSGGSGRGGTGTPQAGSIRPNSSVSQTTGGSLGILKTQAGALVMYLEKELQGFELPEGI